MEQGGARDKEAWEDADGVGGYLYSELCGTQLPQGAEKEPHGGWGRQERPEFRCCVIPLWAPRGWMAILGGRNSGREGTQKTEGWPWGNTGGREGAVRGHCQPVAAAGGALVK